MAVIPGIDDYPPRLPKGTTGDDLTLDDDLAIGGEITTVQGIQFDTDPVTAEDSEGLLRWNGELGVLEFFLPGSDVSLPIGTKEIVNRRVRNQTGVDIPRGTLVRIASVTGQIINIAPADNGLFATALGMTIQDIDDNARGYVAVRGAVAGTDEQPINTIGLPEGTQFWLGTNGTFVGARPMPPDVSVFCGIILREHLTQGEIGLTIIMIWNAANSRFEFGAP
ncbi:MAG: hypothetical protein ACYS7Y_36215 [Planctomycetota bacterium]|jgi:hypothetical protein